MPYANKKDIDNNPSLNDYVFAIKSDGKNVRIPLSKLKELLGVSTPNEEDTTAPTVPLNLTATLSGYDVTLNWTDSTDESTITYLLEYTLQSDTSWGSATEVQRSVSNHVLTLPVGDYKFRVRARDQYNNTSVPSNEALIQIADSTVPSSFVLSGTLSGSNLPLSWTTPTDNVAVTGYRVEVSTDNFSTIENSYNVSTSYTTYNLTLPYGTRKVRVVAFDVAGNETNSNSLDANVLDSTAPSDPTNLVVTITGSTASLSWTNGIDAESGVANTNIDYKLSSDSWDGAWSVSTGTTFDVTNLPNGTYDFRIRNNNGEGLSSGWVESLNHTVNVTDTEAPTAVVLSGSLTGYTYNASWTTATDNVGVTSYRIQVSNDSFSTISQTINKADNEFSHAITLPIGSWEIRVLALDSALNQSVSNVITTSVFDTTAPSEATSFSAVVTNYDVALSWVGANDDAGGIGISHYLLSYTLDGGASVNIGDIGNVTSYNFNGASIGSYIFTLQAVDLSGNTSAGVTTSASVSDITSPSAISGLATTNLTEQIALTWNASTDNVAVTGYQVQYQTASGNWSSLLGNVTIGGTTHNFSSVSVGSYDVRVRSVDGAGNYSAWVSLNGVSVTAIPDTESPTAPTLSATGGTTIVLTWSGDTDNVGVTGYNVRYGGAADDLPFEGVLLVNNQAISSPYTANVLDGSYKFQIQAVDGAGNVSPWSNESAVVTKLNDTQAPTIPTGLATTNTEEQIALTWNASTDNVAVTGYRVQYQAAGGNWSSLLGNTVVGSTTHAFIEISAGNYDARVQALDAEGNASAFVELLSIAVTNSAVDYTDYIYFGQGEPAVALDTAFFESVNGDADNNINVASYTLGTELITAQEDVVTPFLGSPFANQSEQNKTSYFFAIPSSFTLVEVFNTGFDADKFWANGGSTNVFTTSAITINGIAYTLYDWDRGTTLGSQVTIRVQNT